MNEILQLRKNYTSPSSKVICKLIERHASARDSFIRENELRLTESQEKIEVLSYEVSIAKEKLDVDKKVLEEKIKELEMANEKLKELETEKNRILKSNKSLERKCRDLRMTKPNEKDQWILDLGLRKVKLYKQLTRIRWDFGALEEVTKGFVTDHKKYIRTFCYPKEIQGEELSDLLWKEIELSMDKKLDDDGDKENSASNT